MSKTELIEQTIDILNQMPEEKTIKICEFLIRHFEEQDERLFEEGFKKLVSESKSYDFLKDEPELYSVSDCIEVYHHEKR